MDRDIYPEDEAIHRAIAAAKSESDYLAILEDINRENNRFPSDFWLTEMRGTVSYYLGRFTDAIEDLSTAEASYLENYQDYDRNFGSDEYLNYLRMMLGSAYRSRSLASKSKYDLLPALAYFEGAAAADERSAVAWSNVSDVLWAIGRREDAIRAAKKSVDLNPRDASAWSDLFHYQLRTFKLISAARVFFKGVKVLMQAEGY